MSLAEVDGLSSLETVVVRSESVASRPVDWLEKGIIGASVELVAAPFNGKIVLSDPVGVSLDSRVTLVETVVAVLVG